MGKGHEAVGVNSEGDTGLQWNHRMTRTGLEQRQHCLAAVSRDLQGSTFESGRPEIEGLDGLEAELLCIPSGGFGTIRYSNVDMI